MYNQIGKKIYYDKSTGAILVDTGEREGYVVETTIDEDILTYKALAERIRGTFDLIQLEFGQYYQDFIECNGYKVNTQTNQIEFSYPNPNEEPQEPIYQEPLSTRLERLEQVVDTMLGGEVVG